MLYPAYLTAAELANYSLSDGDITDRRVNDECISGVTRIFSLLLSVLLEAKQFNTQPFRITDYFVTVSCQSAPFTMQSNMLSKFIQLYMC